MRRRILVAIVGVAAIAVVGLAVPLGVTFRHLVINDEMAALERSAESVERAVDPANVHRTPMANAAEEPEHYDIAVYDTAGRRVAGEGPDRLEVDLRGALSGAEVTHARADLRVAVPIGLDPDTTGAVRAFSAAGDVEARIVRVWVGLAILCALTVVVAGVLAWWLSRRLNAPLAQLSTAAHKVGDGDFATPIPRSGVAEIDEVADALEGMTVRVGATLERERSFNNDVSHQLRTRVAALRITLEQVGHNGTTPDLVVADALEETEHFETTIEDVLTLARGENVVRDELDVRTLVPTLRRAWHGVLAGEGRMLVIDVVPGVATALASMTVTRQILDILIDNAYRHGAGDVTIRARPVGESIAIDVIDQGPGVGGDLDLLLARRDAERNGHHHGIGLALARTFADAQRGRLVAVERPDGAQFTLFLSGHR